MEKFVKSSEIPPENYIEIIKNSFYFAVLKSSNPNKTLKGNSGVFCFSIDEELVYQNYYSDFGPLNIACVYKYCSRVNRYFQYSQGLKTIVHYTTSNPSKKANAAFLVGAYCVICLKRAHKTVFKMMQELGPYRSFVDASQYPCNYTIQLSDCFAAISKALAFNFFNFEDFNMAEYDLYNKLEFGDLNWVIPRKFLAFVGPADNRTAHPPDFYVKYFLNNDVKTVIRLNHALYDSRSFVQAGIQHYDLIFPDGTTPPKDILLKFLYIAENAPAAIAVHCKAGLGRTGSLIGAYLMKHYRMTARESIAWLRICRPGSVIGQQQLFLDQIQSWLWRTGSQYRLQHYGEGDKIPRHKYGIYSKRWPAERDKKIREARRSLQNKFTKNQLEHFLKKRTKASSVDRMVGNSSKCLGQEQTSFDNISKILSSVHGIENENKILPISNSRTKSEKIIAKPKDGIYTKHNLIIRKNKKITAIEKALPKHNIEQSLAVKNTPSTQGDKLVEIKAMRNKTRKKKELDQI